MRALCLCLALPLAAPAGPAAEAPFYWAGFIAMGRDAPAADPSRRLTPTAALR